MRNLIQMRLDWLGWDPLWVQGWMKDVQFPAPSQQGQTQGRGGSPSLEIPNPPTDTTRRNLTQVDPRRLEPSNLPTIVPAQPMGNDLLGLFTHRTQTLPVAIH